MLRMRKRDAMMTSDMRSLAIVIALALLSPGPAAQVNDRGWTIVGADLADGSGSALRRANVRFVGDRVVSVGAGAPARGDTVVDGAGLVVAPGFIDIHNHSAEGLASDPAAATQVAQGITTLVVGPDGGSPWPIGEYLAERRRNPAAVNVAAFAGHATVRRLVMGDDFKRPARADEVARMAALVDQAMREGAMGLSSGLEYEVGGYAETSELVELSKVAARHGGIYMSHIRDEADKSFEALREAVEIGERAAHPRPDLSHQAGHGRRVAQGGGRDRADRRPPGSAASTSRRTRTRTTPGAPRSPCSCPTSATTIRRASRRRSPTSAERRTS